MPTKNLAKVQKHIARKQNGKKKALHENSRDARRIRTASRRMDKIAAVLSSNAQTRQPYIDRVFYFQGLILPEDEIEPVDSLENRPWTTEQLQQAIQGFLSRHDDEIAAVEAERRPGRPPSKQEANLKQRKTLDQTEYTSGLWVPDLRDETTLRHLEKWNGDWSAMAQMKYERVYPDGTIAASAFPPTRSQ